MSASPTKGKPLVRSKSLAPNSLRGRRGNNDSFGGLAASPVNKGLHFAISSGQREPGNGAAACSTPHIIALVGLPARGKTYISKKLNRYLNWIGVDTKVVNLGDYRRKCSAYNNHNLFNPNNPEGVRMREQVCEQGLQDAFNYIERDGMEVVVFDATNTTIERRALLRRRVVEEKGFKLFFVESICDDERLIENNIRSVKVTNPDYVGFTPDQVVEDFKKRIQHYADAYETIDEAKEPNLSFLKIFNAGQKVLVHKHEGHIQSRIVYYLMNINLSPRTIYITRHGESEYNVKGTLGGDSLLTERGKEYARALSNYMNRATSQGDMLVWTSCLQRTMHTARYVHGSHEKWKALNEIDVGTCDGLTYRQIREKYPSDFAARDVNKYGYRYPMGESYQDVVHRLEPVIMELERQTSVLVVSHQAVLRCILAYYLEIDEADLPYLETPLHTLFRLEPRAYGCDVSQIPLGVDCVDTHRPRPEYPGRLGDSYIETVSKDDDDDSCVTCGNGGSGGNSNNESFEKEQ